VPRRSRRALMVLPTAVEGFEQVESIKVLSMTISHCFSVPEHVNNLLAACAQTLFALHTLRQHGLLTVVHSRLSSRPVVAKLAHASRAWRGFASVADKPHIEAFLRRSVHFSYRADSASTDDKLFRLIKSNSRHVLRPLLPPFIR
jgi:hypothetical protein